MKDIISLPRQKVSSKSKTKKWFEKSARAAINIAMEESNSVRLSNEDKIRNLNLYDGIIDEKDLKKHFDTLGIYDANYSPSFKNFGTIRDRIGLLEGEYIERGEEYGIALTDSNSISSKLKEKQRQVTEYINSILGGEDMTDDEIKAKLEEFESSKFSSRLEKGANKLLEIIKKRERLTYLKTEGFKEALIVAEAIFCVDVVNDELKVRKCNPLKTYVVRNGLSNDVKEAEIIVEVRYMPRGKVIDELGEFLNSKQIDYIVGTEDETDDSVGASFVAMKNLAFESSEDLEYFGNNHGTDQMIDKEGNIRVARVVWKGYRKIFKRKYYDENALVQYDFVSEYYTPNTEKGEVLTPRFITEWHEATLIGSKYVVNAKVKDMQFRSINNPSVCQSGYVGGYFNILNNKARSMVDLVAPYLYLKNITFARIEDIMARNMGKVMELDFSKFPDGWKAKKIMFYIKAHGIKAIDNFKEGSKGVAQGKLAGMYNTGTKAVDMDISGSIVNYLTIINELDEQIARITGVTEQRLGSINSRELVGNVERSRIQSSHITEYWFNRYERIILDLYETILNTAKHLVANGNTFQAVLDDFTVAIFEGGDFEFASGEYGLFATSTSRYKKLRASLEAVAINAVPNGQMSKSELISLYKSNNVHDMAVYIEEQEKKKMIAENARIKQEQEQALMMLEKQQNYEKEKIQMELDNNIQIKMLEIKSKENVVRLQAAISDNFDRDEDGDGIDDTVELIKQKMINEQKDKELDLKRDEMKSKEKIALKTLKYKNNNGN